MPIDLLCTVRSIGVRPVVTGSLHAAKTGGNIAISVQKTSLFCTVFEIDPDDLSIFVLHLTFDILLFVFSQIHMHDDTIIFFIFFVYIMLPRKTPDSFKDSPFRKNVYLYVTTRATACCRLFGS